MSEPEEEIVNKANREENGNCVEAFSADYEEKNATKYEEDECEVIEDCWGVPKHEMVFDPDFSRNDIYMFSAGNTLNDNLIFQGNFEGSADDASNSKRQEEFSFKAVENSSPLPPKIVDEVWKVPYQESQPEKSPDNSHKFNENTPTEPQPALIYRSESPASPAEAAPRLPSTSPPLVPNTDNSNYFKFFTPMQFTAKVKATTRSINFTPYAEKKNDNLSDFLKSTLDSDLNLEELVLLPSKLEESTYEFAEERKEAAKEADEKIAEFVDNGNENPAILLMFDSETPPQEPSSSILFNEDEKGEGVTNFGDTRSSSQESSQESTENSSSRELGEIFDKGGSEEKNDTEDSDEDFIDCENNNFLVDVSESTLHEPLKIIIDETSHDFFGSICDDKSFNVAAISPRENGAESISQNFSDFTNDMLANDYTLIETQAKSGKRRLSKSEDILEKINEEPVAEEALSLENATTLRTLEFIGEEQNSFVVDWSHLSEDAEKTNEAKEEAIEETDSGEEETEDTTRKEICGKLNCWFK